MRIRPLLAASLLSAVTATMSVAAPAHAFPHFTTVACDTVSTTPMRVRTTFDLDMVGPGGWNWFFMDPQPVGPAPTDSTHFYSCGAPVGWTGLNQYPGSPGFIFYPSDHTGFGTGGHFVGFSVVADRPGPCAHFIFDTGLLDDNNLSGDGCLSLDHPVPATRSTWGQLKATYRN